MNTENKMTVWAHRGGANNFEDNSLEAIKNSLSIGCSGIEIDAWLHKGELVLSHDGPSSTALTRLEDMLKLINGQIQIYLEIKHPEAAETALELIEKSYMKHSDTVVFASFDTEALRIVREKSASARLGLNYRGVDNNFIDIAEELAVEFVTFNWKRFFPNYFNIKQSRGAINAKYLVYTIDSPRFANMLFKLGADGIITDWPDKFSSP